MIESDISEVKVDELMEKIRAEVKQGKEGGGGSSGVSPGLYAKIDLPDIFSIPDLDNFEIKDRYHINDFLKFRDRNFVMIAYRGILIRRPDSRGLEHFLDNLRSGKMTKAEILGRLRYAPEGRVKKKKGEGFILEFPHSILIQNSSAGILFPAHFWHW